jgi:glycosyltransferase involved in cell wall biosynthesis
VSGTGDDEKRLKQLAAGDPRIEFVGHISDEQLISLYAGALAIPFVSVREDYGYVTLEAFASGKPVLTCRDSGEPTRFVLPGETGLVREPTVEAVREGLEWLFDNRDQASRMGAAGKDSIANMSWHAVAQKLIDAAMAESLVPASPFQVTTVDMQPIDPPVGGGRLRLLGLYHGLDMPCTYVGTYDWPGEPARDHKLSASLREISVPLSNGHHSAAAALALQCNGKTMIDLAFSQQAHLSPEFIEQVREQVKRADVVVFSHPWVYPLIANMLLPHQVIVYDSHNVEGFLRAQLLDNNSPAEQAVLRQAIADEYDVGSRADLILACSQEDLARFNRIYEFNPEKMRVIPNGVMAFAVEPATPKRKIQARKRLKMADDAFIAIFIGSPYGPNVDAANFIASTLADVMSDIVFVIAGGVGDAVNKRGKNVVCTGGLSEEEKLDWLQASDIAVNPMFSGSGTNIKMFDFMALGLPTVVTEIGARGITRGPEAAFVQVGNSENDFVKAIRELQQSPKLRESIGSVARQCVENQYSWERISRHLGNVLRNRAQWADQQRPLFSVVVPSYERHGKLDELLEALGKQVERDFEVIVVDQSAQRWPNEHAGFGIPLTYIHTDVKGAVSARNTGAAVANGQVIAFTDDDCLPAEDWLFNARGYFINNAIVGLEGVVVSDHYGDPEWRTVSNVGFEGMGFMTANMMVRSSAFHLLGGFDIAFDKPHFREDTDFGWRLQEFGVVPYGHDVEIFHPAQPRSVERESLFARAAFFRKDALLYKKHPEKYQQLFFTERHFDKYPGYAEQLIAGFEQQGITMPQWMLKKLKQPS